MEAAITALLSIRRVGVSDLHGTTFRDFASYRLLQIVPHLSVVGIPCTEIHKLGHRRFHSAVESTHHPRVFQLVARVIASHLHFPCQALAHVDNGHALVGCLLQQVHQPGYLRCVATAKRPHHNAFQMDVGEHVSKDFLLYSGEEREYHYVGVHLPMRDERFVKVGLEDMVAAKGEVDAGLTQMRIVERLKGIEFVGVNLRTAVASEQVTTEVDTHLGHCCPAIGLIVRSQFYTGHEILLAIRSELSNGQLASREDDGLGEVLEHE